MRFATEGLHTSRIYNDAGIIQVFATGVYCIEFTVNFPAAGALNTTFTLQVNNQPVPGAVLRARKEAGTPFYGSIRTILRLKAVSVLRVSSLSTLSVRGEGANDTLAVFTIVQLA